MTYRCRLLMTLLIAVSLILAPVGGALAIGGLPGDDHLATVDCPETVVDRSAMERADQRGALSDLSVEGAVDHCCELPCTQCGHCPVTSLPAAPGMGIPAHSSAPQSAVASLIDLHTAPAHRPPKAG
jgi:hypothetical protein